MNIIERFAIESHSRTISYGEASDILQKLLFHMRQDEAIHLIKSAYHNIVPNLEVENQRRLEEYHRFNLELERKKLETVPKYMIKYKNGYGAIVGVDSHVGDPIKKKDFISEKEMEI